jgi:pheromone shutdown protein TraB
MDQLIIQRNCLQDQNNKNLSTTEDKECCPSSLPMTELPPSVTVLRDAKRTVYVVGTAHVSAQSARDVAQVIRAVQPDAICLELCRLRLNILAVRNATLPSSASWFHQLCAALRRSGTSGLFAFAIERFYSHVGSLLDLDPGIEFRVALSEGLRLSHTTFWLIDRRVDITLQRTWQALSCCSKVKLFWWIMRDWRSLMTITKEDIEMLKSPDILSAALEELGRHFPSLAHTLVYERDLYLACALKRCPGNTIVAVVGAGHVKGISEHWQKELQPEKTHDELNRIRTSPSGYTSAQICIAFLLALVPLTIGSFLWVFGRGVQ